MWTPRTSSVCESERIFTNPSVSCITVALALAVNGNLPTLYFTDKSFSSSSVFPTDATSGKV